MYFLKSFDTIQAELDIDSLRESYLKSTYRELVIVNGYGRTEDKHFLIPHTIDLPIKNVFFL